MENTRLVAARSSVSPQGPESTKDFYQFQEHEALARCHILCSGQWDTVNSSSPDRELSTGRAARRFQILPYVVPSTTKRRGILLLTRSD
jgi:hypothetical protein